MLKNRRGVGFRDVTLIFDDGHELPVPAVRRIRSGLANDGRAVCLLTTLDVDFARSLAPGTRVRLVARLCDIFTREPEAERTEFGRFRVAGPPLYSAGSREFTTAKIRLVEGTARPTLHMSCSVDERLADAEPGVRVDEFTVELLEAGHAAPARESGHYRSFFFDERGGPITREPGGG